ncbi:MAG: HEAT repeat domain-containing protein [Verrucomicrobia bacterium]|nr:HEAT repeat domain-containing protein [Verrucomicrobiota bacterium]
MSLKNKVAIMILPALLAAALAADPAPGLPAGADAYAELGKVNFDTSYGAIYAIQNEIIKASPEQLKAIEAKLLAVLQKPDTAQWAKEFICKTMRQIGSEKCVPALAALLTDEKLSHVARYGLQNSICPAAGEALLAALDKTSGKLKVGVVTSLGERLEAKAVPQLTKLIVDADPQLAGAAIMALGYIGGAKCAAILAEAKPADVLIARRADAVAMCADSMLAKNVFEAANYYRWLFTMVNAPAARIAGLRGLVRAEKAKALPTMLDALGDRMPAVQKAAVRCLLDLPGAEATKAFAGKLAGLSPELQIALSLTLMDRGDRAALPMVTALVASENEPVRVAAITALAKLGNESSLDALLKAATTGGDTATAATESLKNITGKGIDAALVKRIAGADAKAKTLLIQTLGARRAIAAQAALEQATADKDGAVSREAFKALGLVADEAGLSKLVALVEKNPDNTDAQDALVTASRRMYDQKNVEATLLAACDKSKGDAHSALLKVVGQVGGLGAFATLRAALKDNDEKVRDAAVRALASADDTNVLPDLLGVIKSSPNKTHRVLALRGYTRIVGLGGKRAEGETLKHLKDALPAAKEPDEKKLLLGALANIQNTGALKAIEPLLADDAVKAEAGNAYLKIVESVVKKQHNDAVAALKKCLELTQDVATRAKAKRLLDRYEPAKRR